MDLQRPHTYRDFNSRSYLEEYYVEVSTENLFLLSFYHELYKHLPPQGKLLEVGGGPTVYQLISASSRVEQIVFSDFLESNLLEVEFWMNEDPLAFDWTPYFETVSSREGVQVPELEARLRSKIRSFLFCDMTKEKPVMEEGPYDIVNTSFCIESITQDRAVFEQFFPKLRRLVKEGGMLVGTVIRDCTMFRIDSRYFPATRINETEMSNLLEGAGFSDIQMEILETDPNHGYSGIMAFAAKG